MEVAHQQLMAVLMPHTAARKADERCKQQDGEAAVLHAAGSKAPSLWRRNGAPSVLVTASVAYGHSLDGIRSQPRWHTITATIAYGHGLHYVTATRAVAWRRRKRCRPSWWRVRGFGGAVLAAPSWQWLGFFPSGHLVRQAFGLGCYLGRLRRRAVRAPPYPGRQAPLHHHAPRRHAKLERALSALGAQAARHQREREAVEQHVQSGPP